MRNLSTFKSRKGPQTSAAFHLGAIWLLIMMSALTLPDQASAFVKETGMGSIGVAYPQSALAARYNPATLTEIGNRIDLVFGLQVPRGRLKIEGSEDPILNQSVSLMQCRYFVGMLVGYSKQITPKITASFSGDSGIATSSCSTSRTVHPFGRGPFSVSNLVGVQEVSVAYKFNNCHSIGFTLPFYLARSKINGAQNSAAASLYPHHVSNKGYCWAFGVGVKVGWFWHITKKFSFGIAYNSCLLASSHFRKYMGASPSKGKFQSPADLWTGIAYNYGRGTVGFQMHRYFFSQINIFHNPVDSPHPLGSTKGPGSGFNDVTVWEVGADYNVTCNLKLRGGFEYVNPTFVRRGNVTGDFSVPVLIAQKKTPSIGLTYKFKTFELSMAYLVSFKATVKGPPSVGLAGGRVIASGGPTHGFLFGIENKY